VVDDRLHRVLLERRAADVERRVAIAVAHRLGHATAQALEDVEAVGVVEARNQVLHQIALTGVDEKAVGGEVLSLHLLEVEVIDALPIDAVLRHAFGALGVLAFDQDR
jgi:hypothetical protein